MAKLKKRSQPRRKTLGTDRDHPWLPRDFGDTMPGFHEHVPMGAWYRDETGALKRRTKPPPPRRGPKPGTLARYKDADRDLFPEMERIMREEQKSPYAAACKLADDGKISGTGTPTSRAKRLVKFYLAETR